MTHGIMIHYCRSIQQVVGTRSDTERGLAREKRYSIGSDDAAEQRPVLVVQPSVGKVVESDRPVKDNCLCDEFT